MTTTTPKNTGKPSTRKPSTTGQASKPAGKKGKPAAEKAAPDATSKSTAPKATTADTAAIIAQARQHYGCSAVGLMGKLKADGYDGRTLAERLKGWADARQQADADASAAAIDGALAKVEPADVPAAEPNPHGWETIAPVGPTQPEPELIPADTQPLDESTGIPANSLAAPVVPVVPVVVRSRINRTASTGANLKDAHRQWADRPADERYWTIADALEASRHHRETAREVSFDWNAAAIAPSDDGADIVLYLPDGTAATFTHHTTNQLCGRVQFPHQALAILSTDLAARVLEERAAAVFGGKKSGGNALVHQNGCTKLRSLNSDRYARFWNCEVFEALLPLTEQGWRTPPARPSNANDPRSRRATAEDVLTRRDASGGIAVNVGDWISPAGIYASDHDMFAFLVNEDMRLDDGTPDGLARGFFVSNSEAGKGALKLKAFYYRQVCGNHIVWGAEHVVEVNVRHVGTFDSIRTKFAVQVKAALDSFTSASLADDQRTINRARNYMLTTATDPETARKEVLQALIAGVSENRTLKPATGISVKLFDGALDLAVQFADVDHVHPYSLWGAVNGLTRYSQSAAVGLDFADERAKVDALTEKLMKLVGAADMPAIAV